MKVPALLAARLRPRRRCRSRSWPTGSASPAPRSRRSSAAASPDLDGNLGLFRVGRVLEAAKHPNADRLQLCRVDVGEGEPRQIVCGAWNFGAGRDRRRGAPRRRAAGRRPSSSEPSCAGEISRRDDPLRARARARRRPHGDHGAATRSSRARRSPTCCRSPTTCSTSRRPATGRTCSPSTGSRARWRRSTTLELAPPPGRDPSASRRRAGRRRDRGPRGLPALHRPPLPRRRSRPVAALAAGAPDRGRDAADLERRRRDELRRCSRSATRSTPSTTRRCAAGGSSSAARDPGEKLRTLDGVDRAARRPTT